MTVAGCEATARGAIERRQNVEEKGGRGRRSVRQTGIDEIPDTGALHTASVSLRLCVCVCAFALPTCNKRAAL